MLRFKTNEELEAEFGIDYTERIGEFNYVNPFMKDFMLGRSIAELGLTKIRRCWHSEHGEWGDFRATPVELLDYFNDWFNQIPREPEEYSREDGTTSYQINLYLRHAGHQEEMIMRCVKVRRWMITHAVMCVEEAIDDLKSGDVVVPVNRRYGHVVNLVLSDQSGGKYISTTDIGGREIYMPFSVLRKVEEEIKQHL